MSQIAVSLLILALRKAHVMESQALERLERRATRLERFPELQAQIQHHLGETERQLERIEDCLDALGEEAPGSHTGSTAAAPVRQALPGNEELLDEAYADYALETYEIVAYKSLLTLCEVAVQRSIAPLLQESLKEEEAMARWVKDNISRLTRDYVIECERNAGTAQENATMKENKPPRPDTGGQRGQGDQRDHEPSGSPPKRKGSTPQRQGVK